MGRLYHVVSNNIKNKYHCNDAIAYEQKFDNKFSVYLDPPMDPLPLVTGIINMEKNIFMSSLWGKIYILSIAY